MDKAADTSDTKAAPVIPLSSSASDTALSERTDIAMSIDPEEAVFPMNGAGKSDHMVVNFTKSRLALKAKCSNNEMYRVNPVFQVIEPRKCKNISITRTPGPQSKKSEKVLVVYHPCDEKITDLKALFKELETKHPEELKYMKIPLLGENSHEKKKKKDLD